MPSQDKYSLRNNWTSSACLMSTGNCKLSDFLIFVSAAFFSDGSGKGLSIWQAEDGQRVKQI